MKVNIKGVYCKRKQLASGQVRIYYYHRATNTRLPDDPTDPAFHQQLATVARQGVAIIPAARTFSDLVREYRRSVGYQELRASTKSEYDRHIRYVEPALSSFAVRAVKRPHIEKIMQKFAGKPTLARAIKRTLSVLFTYASNRLEWIEANPTYRMESQRKRNEVGQRPLSEAEIATFRKSAPTGSRARLAFEIGLSTACRREDILLVPARELDGDTLTICTSKTGEVVVVPITSSLREAWTAWRTHLETQGVFSTTYAVCSEKGSKLHKRTLSKDMETAYDLAGLPDEIRLHALRYTAAVRLLESGFSYDDIAEHTGHRMAAMARKYCAKRRNAKERGKTMNILDQRQD